MQVIHGSQTLKQPIMGSVVTVGNFDGVHIGHRQLISQLLAMGQKYQVPTVVFTFSPHPAEVLAPNSGFRRLFSQGDLQEQLRSLGIHYLVIESFTKEFSQVPAEEFVQDWLWQPFRPKGVLVGHDFSFGRGRTGSAEVLAKVSDEKGFEFVQVPAVEYQGGVVSSSRIRHAVGRGEMALAKELLGRNFYLKGVVEAGAQRGRKLGFPTANVTPAQRTLPGFGVYCSKVEVAGRLYPAVTNVGVKPTFSGQSQVSPVAMETHIFDQEFDLYGQEIRVLFYEFIRAEQKFSSVQELRNQIELDIQVAREYFKNNEMG